MTITFNNLFTATSVITTLSQAVLGAHTYLGAAGEIVCEADNTCSYNCCSVATQFKDTGFCVEREENERCVKTKRNHMIWLVSILAAVIVLVIICGFLKKSELSKKKSRLA